MPLPKDPNILLGYINMKLRDSYPTLAELCASEDIDEDELKRTLSSAGFTYDPARNAFG